RIRAAKRSGLGHAVFTACAETRVLDPKLCIGALHAPQGRGRLERYQRSNPVNSLRTAVQLQTGRYLANLSHAHLPTATGVSLPTIKRAESVRAVSVSARAVAEIRAALESAGVIFVNEKGKRPEVRLRKAIPRATLNVDAHSSPVGLLSS